MAGSTDIYSVLLYNNAATYMLSVITADMVQTQTMAYIWIWATLSVSKSESNKKYGILARKIFVSYKRASVTGEVLRGLFIH